MANNWNDPYRPLPSLADSKSLKLEQSLQNKRAKFDPNVPTAEEAEAAKRRLNVGTTDLADILQSSLLQTGGNLADAFRGVSNKVLGTEFEDTGREVGWSNIAVADEAAGVSKEARAEAQAEDQAAMQAIAEKRYGDAFTNVLSNAPRHLAEQAGTLTELAAGAVATGGIGTVARLAYLGKKGKDAFDAAKQAQKTASKFEKFVDKTVKKGAKTQGQTFLLNADILQGIREDYKEANNGEEPSFERMVGAGVLVAATTSFQPAIIKNFWLPQGKKLAQGNMKKKFQAEIKGMMKFADQSLIKNVADTVAKGALKVGKAAGAEGVQEYFQSWAEILSVKMDPQEAGGLLQSAFNEIADEENKNDATYGAFVGAVVGGSARATTAVPVAAVGVTADTALAAGKQIAKQAGKANAKVKFGALSDAEKKELLDEYNTKEAVHNELVEENTRRVDVLKNVSSLDKVADEGIRQDIINQAEGADLSDPDIFKQVRNQVIRKYRGRIGMSKAELKGHYVYQVGKKKFQKAAEQTKEFADKYVDVEQIKEYASQVADTAVDLGEAAVEEIKNLDTAASVGFAELVVDYAKNQTKEGWTKLEAAANQQSPKAIRAMADVMPDGSKAQIRLRKIADRREASVRTSGLKKDRIVTFDKLSDITKTIAQAGITSESGNAVATHLREEMKGRPDDKKTVQTLQKAIAAYEKSDHASGQNRISKATLKSWKKSLDKHAEAYSTPVQDTIEGITTNITKQLATAITNAGTAAVDWTKGKFEKVPGFEIDATPAGINFLKVLNETTKGVKDMDEDAQLEFQQKTIQGLTSAKRMEAYKNLYNTQDPQVLAEILSSAVPVLDTKLLMEELVKAAPEADTKADTKADTETKVKKVEDTKKVKGTPVTESGNMILTEDGQLVVTKNIPDDVFKKAQAKMSGIVICKKG